MLHRWSIAFLCLGLAASAHADELAELRERARLNFEATLAAEPERNLQRMAETPCVDGFAGVYPCDKIDLFAFMPLSEIGGGSGNDIWGWTDPQTGREYALMGRSTGTAFVDVTDPVNPVYVGNLPGRGSPSSWRDVKVHADHAYVVSESFGHGMQVFDLNQLRDVVSPPATFNETAHYDDFGNAHNVAINEETGFAYAVGTGTCGGGPHFVDLADPAAPVFAGCHVEAIYTHDTQCVVYNGPDADYVGREICINSNTNKINIVDVTTKPNTSLISSVTYNGVGYTHQGWLTEDQRYWLQGDELDESNFGHNTRTRIYDLLDLDNPVQLPDFDGPNTAADHNLYILGDYAFEANYRAGLQIYELSDVANGNLELVASFDTYPSSNSASTSGAWSVYPYFESGTVVVSGIGEGLFVLGPVLAPTFRMQSSAATLSVCAPGDATATVTLNDRNGYSGDVALSATGLPPGASASFDVDPVAVPGSSEMTLSVGSVPGGAYPFKVAGSDGTIEREIDATLEIADDVSAVPATLLPVDGALGVARTPTLSWNAAPGAFDYEVEVAAHPSFNNVIFSAQTSAQSVTIAAELAASATYYWRVRGINACDVSSFSPTASFTTLAVPAILLVDDDDNVPNVRGSYTDALDAIGVAYDLWNTSNTDDEPTVGTLAPYKTVLWFTGAEFGGQAGPGPGGESALASWLDDSGCLLIASQDYFYDRGLTGFMSDHLGVVAATSDTTQTSLSGIGPFAGLGPYGVSPPYSNLSDRLLPDGTGSVAWNGSTGSAAISKDTGSYRTSYWGFGLEAIPGSTNRRDALAAMLAWCDALEALDGDSDGAPNGADCAPTDPTLFATPSPVEQLTVTIDALSWAPVAQPGGDTVLYDTLRFTAADDFAGGNCIEIGDGDTATADAALPAPDGLYYYLIRARNGCGQTLGTDSYDVARSSATCF